MRDANQPAPPAPEGPWRWLRAVAFVDAGQAWDFGTSREQAEWRRGVGGGLFLIASVVTLNLDIARGLKTGDMRVHFSSGFSF